MHFGICLSGCVIVSRRDVASASWTAPFLGVAVQPLISFAAGWCGVASRKKIHFTLWKDNHHLL